MNTPLEKLKNNYRNTEIPEEKLMAKIEDAIQVSISRTQYPQRKRRTGRWISFGAVAALLAFTDSLNTINGFAASLDNVPVLGAVARVLTFRTFEVSSDEQRYDVDIEVPGISGTGNEELEHTLNAAYLADAQARYDAFLAEIGSLGPDDTLNKALTAGYEVALDDGQLFVLKRWVVESAGSSMETVYYDTIDTKNGVLITLPSLFQDDTYIEVISDEILTQMEANSAADEDLVYFTQSDETPDGFARIDADQTFYINSDRKLVIVLQRYSAAPGYMGTLEFEIPTERIAGILASDAYVK